MLQTRSGQKPSEKPLLEMPAISLQWCEEEVNDVAHLGSLVPPNLFCSIWHILSLGGVSEADWTPQFAYRKRPQKLDDGGLKILE